ncbi:MAG: radical SAM protein [Anaerolineae bacterium]
MPITFEVWPSLTCNARCPLCTYALNNARLEADRSENLFVADVSTYKRIFESFRQAGVHSLIITGGGEPTLHPQVADLLSHAYRLGFAWGMFTHGLNLTEKLIHDFLACEPRFIRVSVNAGSARSHELEYRVGKGSYAQVAQNVTLAAKISHQYNRVIGLGVRVKWPIEGC